MANLRIKTALDYIRRSPFQAMAAVFVLSLTFFVTTLLIVIVYSSSNVINYFETRPQVIAFLKDDATPEQVSQLQNKLLADNKVSEVKYVSKEQALEIYKKATSDNPLLSELVSPTIFPASLEFSLKDLSHAEDVINQVKKESIVDQVGFTASLGGESTLNDVVNRLRTITTYLRVGGGVITALLIATSYVVLIVIITMRMAARKGEIEILSLIGATKGFIRDPILLEALIYALVGVFIGWVITFLMVLYAAPSIISYFGEIPILPRTTLDLAILFGIIFVSEILIGAFLAFSGSLLAISRAQRRK
jgi:cell division transport system permease protein